MKRSIAAATALATGLLLAVGAGPASAADHNDLTVNVTGHGDGVGDIAATVSSHRVHQGYLTLHVNDDTAIHDGVEFTVVHPHGGHSIGEVLRAIDLQVSENASPADAARSTRILNRIASVYGGADTENAAQFVSSTVFLPHAGNYYLVAVTDSAHNIARIHADHNGDGIKPHSDATLLVGNGDTDTFAPVGLTIPQTGTLRAYNNSDSIHLVQFQKVKDGTTDAQVQAEFDALMAGKNPTSDPAGLNSPPKDLEGIDAITPGNAAYLSYQNLPKGDYLVLCFVADDETGVPHAFMGMHLIIHVA
jgi:hypothetical protein